MTWSHPSTHPTTHPPTKSYTHPWVGNLSQISNLQTELKYLDKFKRYRIFTDSGGPPPWGMADWWMGVGWGGYGCVGDVPSTHTHTHTCTCTHAHTHMHVKHAIHAKHGCLHVGSHLQFLYMYTCVYVHVNACTCMCMCGEHPPPTCPLPRAAGSPKQQNSISPGLIEIIRFCLKILYLWTFLNSYILQLITPDTPHPPAQPPRAEKIQIRRITITLEWIEIIQFCLKICDPWTLLHTYRLGLMCRWGCAIPNGTFLTQKNAPVTLQ